MRNLFDFREHPESFSFTEPGAGLVPKDGQSAAVVRDPIETEPVPLGRGNQRVNFEYGIGARPQPRQAGDNQVATALWDDKRPRTVVRSGQIVVAP